MRTLIRYLAAFTAGIIFAAGLAWVGGKVALPFTVYLTSGDVRLHDIRAADDPVLVAPGGERHVDLIGRDGELHHRWELAHQVVTSAKLLPDRSLLYVAGPMPDDPLPPGLGGGWGLQRVSWSGGVMWQIEDRYLHHDAELLPNGHIAALRWSPLSEGFGERVTGGVPGTEFEGAVWGDQIVEIDPDSGETRVVFDTELHLKPEDYPLPEWENRNEWTHANSLAYVPEDPLTEQEAYIVSFRQISTIMLIARATGEVIWEYGGQWVLNQQHDPSVLPNGKVLVFDNGQYLRAFPSASQVLEIDPRTDEIVWSFPQQRDPFSRLYSSIISGAQRLPNGNTLITYGVLGRLIEVTPDGDIVWDYEHSRHIFKARSYSADMLEGSAWQP